MSYQFDIAFKNIQNAEVEFNPEWKNGTGYLDGACRIEHDIAAGTVAKGVDDFGRRFIMVGTSVGNVVVFERFSDSDSKVIVSNWPTPTLSKMYKSDSQLDDDTIGRILGWGYPQNDNVGKQLEQLAKAMGRRSAIKA